MTFKKLLNPFFFFQQQIHELFTRGNVIEKLFFYLYLFSSLLLLLYSYTQVDLGLVITRVPWLYLIEKQFQYIGYFNRPLSAALYVTLVLIFTALYLLMFQFTMKKKITSYTIWSIIGIVTIILTFSYNAFSYDLFNYLFDAKILTHYHQNPYLHKALDYPGDPMLGFMHWTHRNYPYGPIWLVLTSILSFLGAQIFMVTFYLFKIFAAASFLGSVYFIHKIFRKIEHKVALAGIVFFSLNPLILIECLVTAHIDIAMTFFMLMSLYFLVENKFTISYLSLIFSIGIKFLTIILLPVYFIFQFFIVKKKKIAWNIFFALCLSLLILGVIIESRQSGNYQPWYIVIVLAAGVFLFQKYYIIIPSVIISVISLFLYVPYIYLGNWNPPVPYLLTVILYSSFALSGIGVVGYFFYKKI